ncbi:MAG: winged helix-turn-helix transcriptional regulator [Gemmatimonadota bacterium]|nr:winged helix-turn-helix transcriptional regulator [Gemmatimonadota bacterium]
MTLESRNVLWKRSWSDDHLRRICGLANAQGGVLEIGKDDAGEVVGIRGVLGLLEEIPNKALSLLGIAVDVNLKSDSGREYIEVVVAPHRNPVSYRGEFHYRTGSTKRVLDAAALRRLLLARFGRRWDDVASPGVGLSDLDGRAVARFRRRAVECERLPPEVLDESVEVLVENLDLRQGAHLKRTAALLFHPSPHRLVPGAYVKLGCFRGPDLLFEDVVRGDLFTQVDVTMDLLYTKYTRGLISYDGIYRVETFPVPRSAMREAVINAVVHRDYASHAPIRIRVRDDRISIRNAARLTPGWSAEALAGERSSRPHNPSIAHAFFRAGLIEAWGLGIRRMMDTCRELGNPMPTWRPEAEGDGLLVTFPFSEAYRSADAVARGIGAPSTTQETARKQPEEGNLNRGLADRILAVLRENPSASRREIAEALAGTTEGSVRYQLDKLKESNRLRRVGPDRGGRWMVLDGDGATGGGESKARSGRRQDLGDGALHHNRQKTARNGGRLPENSQKSAGATRKLPESLPLPDRILAVLRHNPSTSRRKLAAALDTTQSTVRYHLDKLRAAGKIERVGPDKGGHWKVLDVRHTEAVPSG